jgi:hypothetical protein
VGGGGGGGQKGQLLLQKSFINQTAILICEYARGKKQACKVSQNSHLKRRRSFTYKHCD